MDWMKSKSFRVLIIAAFACSTIYGVAGIVGWVTIEVNKPEVIRAKNEKPIVIKEKEVRIEKRQPLVDAKKPYLVEGVHSKDDYDRLYPKVVEVKQKGEHQGGIGDIIGRVALFIFMSPVWMAMLLLAFFLLCLVGYLFYLFLCIPLSIFGYDPDDHAIDFDEPIWKPLQVVGLFIDFIASIGLSYYSIYIH